MHKTFSLPTYTVQCQYLGIATGGFSEKSNAAVAGSNLLKLECAYGAVASTRIVPSGDYDAHLAPQGTTAIPAAALVTNDFNHNLLLRPADCIPLILYGKHTPVLALVHCGRRELDANIIEKTLALISKEYDILSEDLFAYLGPGIQQESYIVSVDTVQTLTHAGWEPFMRSEGENIALDICGFAKSELIRLGLQPGAIAESDINTATDPRYYSHYATTRHGKAAGLNGFAVTTTH